MGHKVHPIIHRTPYIFPWDSRWFAKKDQLPLFMEQEMRVREFLLTKLKDAGVDAISIERSPKDMTINILAAKPGAVIGRGGTGLEELRKHIEKKFLQFKLKVKLNIQPVDQPALSAAIVAQNAVNDIERRLPFRRIMKQTIERVMAAGAKGVKIGMAGRLNGVEIARREKLSAGKMSLITLRSNVDYALAEAHTVYGKIGVKVWIYHGEVFGKKDKFEKSAQAGTASGRKDSAVVRQQPAHQPHRPMART